MGTEEHLEGGQRIRRAPEGSATVPARDVPVEEIREDQVGKAGVERKGVGEDYG